MTIISQSQYNMLLFSMGEKMTAPRSQDHLPTPQQALRYHERQIAEAEQAEAAANGGQNAGPPRDYADWAETTRRYSEVARAAPAPAADPPQGAEPRAVAAPDTAPPAAAAAEPPAAAPAPPAGPEPG